MKCHLRGGIAVAFISLFMLGGCAEDNEKTADVKALPADPNSPSTQAEYNAKLKGAGAATNYPGAARKK